MSSLEKTLQTRIPILDERNQREDGSCIEPAIGKAAERRMGACADTDNPYGITIADITRHRRFNQIGNTRSGIRLDDLRKQIKLKTGLPSSVSEPALDSLPDLHSKLNAEATRLALGNLSLIEQEAAILRRRGVQVEKPEMFQTGWEALYASALRYQPWFGKSADTADEPRSFPTYARGNIRFGILGSELPGSGSLANTQVATLKRLERAEQAGLPPEISGEPKLSKGDYSLKRVYLEQNGTKNVTVQDVVEFSRRVNQDDKGVGKLYAFFKGRVGTIQNLSQIGSIEEPVEETVRAANGEIVQQIVDLHERIPDKTANTEAGVELVELRKILSEALDVLPAEQSRIIELKYLVGLSNSQVCHEAGLTNEQFHRLHAQAMGQLRRPYLIKALEPYFQSQIFGQLDDEML